MSRGLRDKENRDLAKLLRSQGWTWTLSGGGHVKFRSPNGDTVMVSGTASDHRNRLNARALLRRHGAIL